MRGLITIPPLVAFIAWRGTTLLYTFIWCKVEWNLGICFVMLCVCVCVWSWIGVSYKHNSLHFCFPSHSWVTQYFVNGTTAWCYWKLCRSIPPVTHPHAHNTTQSALTSCCTSVFLVFSATKKSSSASNTQATTFLCIELEFVSTPRISTRIRRAAKSIVSARQNAP